MNESLNSTFKNGNSYLHSFNYSVHESNQSFNTENNEIHVINKKDKDHLKIIKFNLAKKHAQSNNSSKIKVNETNNSNISNSKNNFSVINYNRQKLHNNFKKYIEKMKKNPENSEKKTIISRNPILIKQTLEKSNYSFELRNVSCNKKQTNKNNFTILRENELSYVLNNNSEKNHETDYKSIENIPTNQSDINNSFNKTMKSLVFNNKQSFTNLNNLLTYSKDNLMLASNLKKEITTVAPAFDCIEDLHYEFVKFSIKSKKLMKFQENNNKTVDEFSTVIPLEEVELI